MEVLQIRENPQDLPALNKNESAALLDQVVAYYTELQSSGQRSDQVIPERAIEPASTEQNSRSNP